MKNKNIINKGLKVVAATLVLGSVLNIGIYIGTKDNNQSFAQTKGNTSIDNNINKEKVTNSESKSNDKKNIGEENAKEVILSKVNGELISLKYDSEDNEYEGKVKKDSTIFEVDVDKVGNINKFEKEVDEDDIYECSNKEVQSSYKKINEEKAKEIALSKVNGELINLKYDSEDNEYEVKVKKDNFVYEIEISGYDGQVIDFEKESINDDYNYTDEY